MNKITKLGLVLSFSAAALFTANAVMTTEAPFTKEKKAKKDKEEKYKGYKPGDKAKTFKLLNVTSEEISPESMPDAKGFIVVFTCNHCPFSKAYEDRINALDAMYKSKGYPVIAINPNDADQYPDDGYTAMQARALEKGFTFPYLQDADGKVAKAYGAMKTPHVYILEKDKKQNLIVKYVGAIDDATEPEDVKTKYVENAVNNLLAGKPADPNSTKAIGCSIKYKKK